MKKLKVIIFITLFISLFCITSKLLQRYDEFSYSTFKNFYKEQENSVDVVFIGSSNTFCFYSPYVAYKEYGLKTSLLATSAQPISAHKYIIEEARKTQPKALYIISISNEKIKATEENYHLITDNMPLSINKISFVNSIVRHINNSETNSILDGLEFYLPIVKYHSRWEELVNGSETALFKSGHSLMSNDQIKVFKSIEDVTGRDEYTTRYENISNETENEINDLLDYCTNSNINVLFLFPPQAKDESTNAELNTISLMITGRGFDVLDLRNKTDDIGLDLSCDYFDFEHTNIHGQLKYTDYVTKYILEKYGLECDDSNLLDSKWMNLYYEFINYFSSSTLEIEFDINHRDFYLNKPSNLKVVSENGKAYITWDDNKNADGYYIYKKVDNWKFINETNMSIYIDNSLDKDIDSKYTVVPYKVIDGNKYFGDFSYLGESVEIEGDSE